MRSMHREDANGTGGERVEVGKVDRYAVKSLLWLPQAGPSRRRFFARSNLNREPLHCSQRPSKGGLM
jgi:hypothetical protein